MDKLTRFPDWQVRLSEYINAVARREFRPGKFDCMLFGDGAVKAQTGVSFASEWRKYRSLSEGANMLSEAGFDDHVALVASLLPECPVLSARVGDIAVLNGDLGASIGVVQGHSIYVLKGPGLGLMPLNSAIRTFRV